jgi:hypothetical protein
MNSIPHSRMYLTVRFLLDIGLFISIGFAVVFMALLLFSPESTASFGLNFDGFMLDNKVVSPESPYFASFCCAIVVFLGTGVLSLWMLRNTVASLGDESPFTMKNVNRIRIIGWALFVQAYGKEFMVYLIARQLSTVLNQNGTPVLQGVFTLLPDGVILALCVLVLAEVFKHGCTLQQEHDTTV